MAPEPWTDFRYKSKCSDTGASFCASNTTTGNFVSHALLAVREVGREIDLAKEDSALASLSQFASQGMVGTNVH